MTRTELQVKGELIAGCLLTDTADALRELDRAGGIPPGVRFDGDAGAVIAEAAKIPRDIHGDEAALLLMRAVEGVGVSGPRWDKLADRGHTFEIAGHVADLLAHARDVEGLKIINTPGDAGFKLMELQRVYGAADRGAGDGAQTVDAAAWLAEPDDPDKPIVPGLFDHGDRVSIVGQSKARKSFFAMQLAVAIAAGRPFLGVDTVRQSVLLVNGEIRPGPYRKRLRRMLAALGIESKELSGRLIVWNSVDHTEPVTWEDVFTASKKAGVGVVIIDPAYLLMGDEIDQLQAKSNVAAMKRFGREGITLISVFHATKGMIGDRQVIDRVAGSGIYARDASTMIALCEHATEADHVVLSAVTRNHPPKEPKSIKFSDGAFFVADVAAVEKTSRTRTQRTFSPDQLTACFTEDGTSYTDTVSRIRERLAVGTNRAKELLSAAVNDGLCKAVAVGRITTYHATKGKAV